MMPRRNGESDRPPGGAAIRAFVFATIGLMAIARVAGEASGSDAPSDRSGAAGSSMSGDGTGGINDDFIYEAIARYDDRLQSKIDAADGAIISVLAANGAVVLFAIDKIKELERVDEHTATRLIVSSTTVCLLGYLVGLSWPLRADQFSPASFLKRATFEPDSAISEATADLVDAYRDNERVLFAKRLVIVVAIGLLIGAVIAITRARIYGT